MAHIVIVTEAQQVPGSSYRCSCFQNESLSEIRKSKSEMDARNQRPPDSRQRASRSLEVKGLDEWEERNGEKVAFTPNPTCLDNIRGETVGDVSKKYAAGGGSYRGGVSRCRGGALRPHSTPATLLWLEENYEMAEGVCIPRNTLYKHYVDFCAMQGLHPVNAASFGKIIRQQFPGLTTRRLGTRGQSRYHYYGVAIKEGSKYFEVHYSKRGNCGGTDKKDYLKQVNLFQCHDKISSLPEFPSIKDLALPHTVSREKVLTFILMYRTHCQRIFASIARTSFEEVQSLIYHFWSEIPVHLVATLNSNSLVSLIGVCDCMLYREICKVFMPSVLQAVIPESAVQLLRNFARNFDSWLNQSLAHLPEMLKTVKILLGQRFSRMLLRLTSLNHLSQAARMVLNSPEIISQMVQDWRQLYLEGIAQQTLHTAGKHVAGSSLLLNLITNMYREFENLLEENSSLECFCSWLEGLIDRCVLGGFRRKTPFHKAVHTFLVMWSTFGSHLMKAMTLNSSSSFGSFHLLYLTFDDIVMYLIDGLCCDSKAKEFFSSISSGSLPDLTDIRFMRESNTESSCQALSGSPLPSSNIPQVPLVTSSTTPGLSPNPTTNAEVNFSSEANEEGIEMSLSHAENARPNFIISPQSLGSSTQSSTAGESAIYIHDNASNSVTTEGYINSATYYDNDSDPRDYKMSSVIGRNYSYTSTPFNQYYAEEPMSSDFSGSMKDKINGGLSLEAISSRPSQANMDLSYVDAPSITYSDQSVFYTTNYHYQQYEPSWSGHKCRQMEGK